MRRRAGILPYYVNSNGDIYILLGQEKSGQYNILGGQIDGPSETLWTAASRELFEESIGILSISAEYLENLQVLGPPSDSVILLPIIHPNLNIDREFRERRVALRQVRYGDMVYFSNCVVERKRVFEELNDLRWFKLDLSRDFEYSKRVNKFINRYRNYII